MSLLSRRGAILCSVIQPTDAYVILPEICIIEKGDANEVQMTKIILV